LGLYKPALSPFYWIRCPRPGMRPFCESTKIPVDGPTAAKRKENRQLAEAAYAAKMGDLARARYALPAREIQAESDRTFRAWLGWYRDHVAATHRGVERERETLTRFDRDLGALRIADVTVGRVREWITARLAQRGPSGRPISPATVNRELDILKSVLRVAAEHGWIEESPISGMPRLHAPTPQRRVMTPDEESRILAAMLRPVDRALLIMAMDTLCRLGDCLDLRWTDDLGQTLWIPDPKTGVGYQVPVTARLRTALDAVPKLGDYVFHGYRIPETAAERRARVSHMLRRACARCEPPIPYGRAAGGLSWHWATRRTAATRMLLAGAPLSTVQRAGHWASAAMVLDIYADTDDPAVRAAVEGIGAQVQDRPQQPRQRPRAR
jgi:integrase